MVGQIELMFNKVKDDEISLPDFVEWVGKITSQADSAGYDSGYDKGYSSGYSDGYNEGFNDGSPE